MKRLVALLALVVGVLYAGAGSGQSAQAVEENVGLLPQTAPGTPWSFIGFAITAPTDPAWMVSVGTPRNGTLGRAASSGAADGVALVISSELLDAPIDNDTALLAAARDRHARLSEHWAIDKHDETLARHAGTRCARHRITAREPEDPSAARKSSKTEAPRQFLHVTGLSCVHPTEPRLLVEVGMSERTPRSTMNPTLQRDAEQAIASLAFQRYSEKALQTSAELARAGRAQEAEAMLKPYVDADAAWARYFLAQIVQRAVPAPPEAGARTRALLEPAAERGLADAQWMLGTLYLRGGDGVSKDPALAQALLRRAAERGSAGAEYQLGLVLLSGEVGFAPDRREAVLWITRAAARGQKEAQELLNSARDGGPPPKAPAKAP
ncbi:MAG TPA: tetratricopeptide repeat protein [Burkholderiaceae bacterium]|nr:tetratricopeptide repeat protein [Burkholderiaceae bacterium]